MKALIAIAATVYALSLWMFAPRSIWDKELATAKRNQQNPTPAPVPTPETIPQTEMIPDTAIHPITESEPITAIVEPIPVTNPIEPDTKTTSEPQNIETFTTTQLREMAKKQKLNWRPLINGKRKPLNKPQLIQLLTA
jgi:hypothetical protein